MTAGTGFYGISKINEYTNPRVVYFFLFQIKKNSKEVFYACADIGLCKRKKNLIKQGQAFYVINKRKLLLFAFRKLKGKKGISICCSIAFNGL
jgi:hypothetical protein